MHNRRAEAAVTGPSLTPGRGPLDTACDMNARTHGRLAWCRVIGLGALPALPGCAQPLAVAPEADGGSSGRGGVAATGEGAGTTAVAGAMGGGGWTGTWTPGGQSGRCEMTEFALPAADSVPWGIAAGPDGNLWFTEGGGNRIGRIAQDGVITEFPLPAGDTQPDGIVAGPDGALWFAEYNGTGIGRITVDGEISECPIPTPNSRPMEIAVGPDGNLWFTESASGKIGRLIP
jgi:virginiamycin B lyase